MSDINVQSFSGKVKVSNDLTVTTNVHADYFKGDGSLLTNLPSGSGGVWNTNSDNEIYFISSNVGISNADPGHNLSVGSNLYVDDDGSNVLVVTGNVKADHFVGDGSLLTGLSGSGGVWSTNAANEIYFINNNVGISNADPGHNLSVGSNLYVDDDGLDVLVVTGNVNATYLKGNGSMITNLPSGSGGVWSTNADNEIYFISSNVGISNSNPGHNLSVGSNLYVDDDGSNVLVVDGNIAAESIVIGGISIVPSYPLSLVTETGNITPHTIQFTNATTGLVVSSNIVVTGNVTAAYLHGDASNVTAVPAAQITGTLDAARIPTLNQSTTGSAATLTTPRSIGGVNFDGSAAIVPTTFNGATFSGDVTVDSPTFHVDSTDNRVGVGTVSPATPFHISSTNEITTSPAGSSVSQMRYGSTNSTVLFGVSSTAGHISAYDTSSFSTNRNLCFNADGGNVGIGTASPDGPLHLNLAGNSNFTGFTYQNADVKTVMANTGDGGSNISILQVYKSVQNRVPSAIDYHSETATASNVYTYCVNPYGGRIGLGTNNPNSDLTMGARIYNTTGFVGLTGTPSKGDPSNTTTTLPYTQSSTSNPNGTGYYFVNPYPGQAQCTIVYDNAQTTPGGLIYFYQNGPGYQPATTLPNSTVGTSEFTIPLLETGSIRVTAIHMKPVNGCQVRITAVYWVPFSGVTANIREGGKLVLGTVGGLGTPTGSLSFRPEYEQPSGNQLEPKEKVENGLAWMTDLSTWYNAGLGGNGINWSKGNATYGVSTGARIWFQPGSFISTSSGAPGNHGRLNLSAGYSTGTSNTPDITITSNKRVGIGVTNPDNKLEVRGSIQASLSDVNHGMIIGSDGTVRRDYGGDGAGFHFTSNAIWPTNHLGSYANDEIDLGNTSYRYKTIWSNNSLNSTSDDRLKHNEEEVADALGTIKKLKLLKYDKTGEMLAPDYNGDLTGISHHKELGFIAQSVLEIPELSFLVTVPGDPEDALEHGLKRGVEPYGMEYQGINNLLVQAVQELSAKNDSLEARILALENA
jgi:hypothetical protein